MSGHYGSIQLAAITTSVVLQMSHCPCPVHNNAGLVVVTACLASEETETQRNALLAQITKGRAGPGSRMIITAAWGPHSPWSLWPMCDSSAPYEIISFICVYVCVQCACMFLHMCRSCECVFSCDSPKLVLGVILSLYETGSLSHTQSSSIWLVLATSLLWGPPSLLCEVGFTGRPPCPCDMYVGSGDPNSTPHTCLSSTLTTKLSPQH